MPIFEYECINCGEVVEKIVMLDGADEEEFTVNEECSNCGETDFDKIPSVPGTVWDNPDTP